MEDTARYRFELKLAGEGEDETPFIACTPTRKGLPQLQGGALAITLISGTTASQAKRLVDILNEAMDRFTFTTEDDQSEDA